MTKDRIIVALDVPTKQEALELIEKLRDQISFFKIGLQLYTAEGSGIVRAVLATGSKVWLDLSCTTFQTRSERQSNPRVGLACICSPFI